jgi:hypothetical protein
MKNTSTSRKRTQDVTRTEAGALLDEILRHLDTFTRDTNADRMQILSTLFDAVQARGLAVPHPCPGEAHSNPHVDHCGLCSPGWGTVSIPVRVR